MLVIFCILRKMPALPSLLLGAMAGMAEAMLLQGEAPGNVFEYAYSGYVCESGNALMDTLFTAGGMMSMLESVSVILIAMAFGGVMKATRLMDALVAPLISHLRGRAGIRSLTVLSCVMMNAILPDQYLGISMPGQMFGAECEKRGISRAELGMVLLGGGAVTSPLIPWNTCGMYCMSILQVSAREYAPFAFYGMILPLAVILAGWVVRDREHRDGKASA